jgi:hypothetical protein
MLQWMSEQERPPTEEELREMYEQELKRVRVEDVLVQTIVSLINLGGRKAGVAPGTEDERDPEQVRKAIEAVKALLPQVEELLGPDLPKIRDALSQLQLAYAQAAGGPGGPGEPQQPAAEEPQQPEGPGPAQSSGKLWVPGQ